MWRDVIMASPTSDSTSWNGKSMEFGTKVKRTMCLQFSEVILIDLLEGRKI